MMPEPQLLRLLGPDVRLLVWTSDSSLNELTPGFDTMNYLLDGLVRQHLTQGQEEHQIHFIHDLFGAPFCLCFVNVSRGQVNLTMQRLKQLVRLSESQTWMSWGEKPLTPEWQAALDEAFGRSRL